MSGICFPKLPPPRLSLSLSIGISSSWKVFLDPLTWLGALLQWRHDILYVQRLHWPYLSRMLWLIICTSVLTTEYANTTRASPLSALFPVTWCPVQQTFLIFTECVKWMGFVNFVDAQMSRYSPYYDQFLMENIRKINKLFNTEVGRDINLPTKVHLVKAMVFSVVMYGCES